MLSSRPRRSPMRIVTAEPRKSHGAEVASVISVPSAAVVPQAEVRGETKNASGGHTETASRSLRLRVGDSDAGRDERHIRQQSPAQPV